MSTIQIDISELVGKAIDDYFDRHDAVVVPRDVADAATELVDSLEVHGGRFSPGRHDQVEAIERLRVSVNNARAATSQPGDADRPSGQ